MSGSVIHAEARFLDRREAGERTLDWHALFGGFIPHERETVVEFRRTELGVQRLEYPLDPFAD